ncbi:MAG: carbamoyltransferase HypF [Myxococcota bacterium]|nr:carbamoyltransferase HypF [Myxococcota bacterium]
MARVRREVHVRGAVQGVGFRPWALQRARRLDLGGHARNAPGGVVIAVEGRDADVARFVATLRSEAPRGARIESIEIEERAPRGEAAFAIAPSEPGAPATLPRLPLDAPVCDACLAELFDPASRRYRYAFTHCASCGPRAAVLSSLPWDRERSALAAFPACAACRAEYEDPDDRRHHAESIACPACGPRLAAFTADGGALDGDPIERAAALLRDAGVVALKSSGGYHLAADATRESAVALLRARKQRPTRPLALLVPDLATARQLAVLTPADEALLAGPAHAIVVAPRRDAGCARLALAESVAPGIRDLGLLLPYAPLHHLLLRGERAADARFVALVLTSANASGEPTLHDDATARAALRGIADLVVAHDRAVLRPNDDSVFRSSAHGPIPMRLSRAAAPLVLALPGGLQAREPIWAIGGDWKCAPALACGGEILLGEHVGDLGHVATHDAAQQRLRDLAQFAGVAPALAAHDLHPDSAGAALAAALAPRTFAVQHHHAHAVACLVEHGRSEPALALALDGIGYGSDGAAWGGELLRVDFAGFERLAHLERVPLAGGDAAAREPWRMAAMWLARAFPDGAPRLAWHARRDAGRLAALEAIAARGVASPPTSSCGRLFDAVASLLDLVDANGHEAEAAMALEACAGDAEPAPLDAAGAASDASGVIAIAPLVRALVLAHARGVARDALAAAFHHGLADRLAHAVIRVARERALGVVVLTGGCFQNRLLLELVHARLAAAGLAPLLHERLPPNDGALAVGQLAIAATHAS